MAPRCEGYQSSALVKHKPWGREDPPRWPTRSNEHGLVSHCSEGPPRNLDAAAKENSYSHIDLEQVRPIRAPKPLKGHKALKGLLIKGLLKGMAIKGLLRVS